METPKELRELKHWMNIVGMPQTVAAWHLDISPSYLNRVMSGKVEASTELMARIVDLTVRLQRTGLK